MKKHTEWPSFLRLFLSASLLLIVVVGGLFYLQSILLSEPGREGEALELEYSGQSDDSFYKDLKIDGVLKADGVKVAVIDSGVNESLVPVKMKTSFIESGVIHVDNIGHGTQVAGLISNDVGRNERMNALGVSSGVEIYNVQVYNEEEDLNSENLLKGVAFALEEDVDIINISLSVNMDDESLNFYNLLMDEAEDKGVLVVVSAGNEGTTSVDEANDLTRHAWPFVVGSLDQEGDVAMFSNSNEFIDAYVPGFNVLVNDGVHEDKYVRGTSFSAAKVSGVAAGLIHSNPEVSAKAIRDELIAIYG